MNKSIHDPTPTYGHTQKLRTSAELGWKSMLAELWRHESCGFDTCLSPSTKVVINISGRARTQRSGAGQLQIHDATEGMIWISPAGLQEKDIRVENGSLEALHLYMPHRKTVRIGTEELDLNCHAMEIRYEGGFRDPVIEALGRSILSELHATDPVGKLYVETLTTTLDVYLVRKYSSIASSQVALPSPRGALSGARLSRTLALIEAHLADDLSLRELAQEASLSLFHFARAFKIATGLAPHQYVLSRRIARAKEHLAAGQLSLSEVAILCGFASQAHLTNVFKRGTGVTPGAYRNQTRGR